MDQLFCRKEFRYFPASHFDLSGVYHVLADAGASRATSGHRAGDGLGVVFAAVRTTQGWTVSGVRSDQEVIAPPPAFE